jgi:F-type H+-transporting ATPase subunit a
MAVQRAEVENKPTSSEELAQAREAFLARAREDYAYVALAEALEEAKAEGHNTEEAYKAFDLEAAKAEFDAEHAEDVAHEYDEGIFNEEEARHAYHARQLAKTQGLPGNPDRLVVVPFFRGLSTDLNVPLALALIVVLAVQVWGVQALGLPYFYKFINLPALGNLGKKPMGAIDFVVGLIEIISEISRLVSLTFRLFGALFAGGILLVVFAFLVAFILPVPIYILELVIGGMQAYVFATLTIIYASQAVISHHGDEHTVEPGEAAH